MSISRNRTVRVLLVGWLFVIVGSFSHGIRAQEVAPKVDEYMNAAVRAHHAALHCVPRARSAVGQLRSHEWTSMCGEVAMNTRYNRFLMKPSVNPRRPS